MKEYTNAGKLILNHCNEQNITLKDLAKKVDMSYSHLTNLLRGERDITREVSNKIANALGLKGEDRRNFKEAANISNSKIVINTKDKREAYLKFVNLVAVKYRTVSLEQLEECTKILTAKNTETN